MKKVLIYGCTVIVLILLMTGLAYSQSLRPQTLEEIRAQARAEVRREMGVGETETIDMHKEESPAHLRTRLQIMQQSVLVLMVLALIPAMIAKLKGRSFIAWYVLGLLFWIVVFPVSVFLKKQPQPTGEAGETAEEETDIYKKIENLSRLKEKNLLSEDEFESKKKELLERI